MTIERQQQLDFALILAQVAQEVILPHYQRCAVERKADGSEVTVADRGAEEAIRARLAERYPQDAVLGEEFGGERHAGAARQWVIDPLDGTSWFALGMPLFGTLIALLEDGDPVLGVIHMPVLGETVYAARGLGCWFRTRDAAAMPVRVQPVNSLDQAMVSASGVHGSDIQPIGQHAHGLTAVIRGSRKFRSCGDCGQYALLCRGNVHVAIDTIMQPWDIAALVPCVEEAGGVVSSLEGERQGIVHGGSLLASSHRALHDQVLGLLRP